MYTCCLEKNRNVTLTDDEENYLPEEKGNITILYDVTQTYKENYMAMVSSSDNFGVQFLKPSVLLLSVVLPLPCAIQSLVPVNLLCRNF